MAKIVRPVEMTDQRSGDATRRLLVLLSLSFGLLYPAIDGRFGPVTDVMFKGSAVALLALAAIFSAGSGFKWLAAIMAAGALGDMLLEVPEGFMAGAVAFAVGHVIAMVFYLRNVRRHMLMPDILVAIGLIGFGLAMPTLVIPASEPTGMLTLYSVLLCGMAATAWLSQFQRRWVGVGALLFVLSDTFIFMRMGGLLFDGETIHGLLVWYAYYLGQLAIFIGVSAGLTSGSSSGPKSRT